MNYIRNLALKFRGITALLNGVCVAIFRVLCVRTLPVLAPYFEVSVAKVIVLPTLFPFDKELFFLRGWTVLYLVWKFQT